jgi:hypothetical protein
MKRKKMFLFSGKELEYIYNFAFIKGVQWSSDIKDRRPIGKAMSEAWKEIMVDMKKGEMPK